MAVKGAELARRRALTRLAVPAAIVHLLACSVLVDTSGLSGVTGAPTDSDAAPRPTDDAGPLLDGAGSADTMFGHDAGDADIAAGEHPYVLAVQADVPRAYLRLEEQSASSGARSAIAGGPGGTYPGGATLGVAGAFSGSRAVRLDGSSPGGVALANTIAIAMTKPFSLELWFQPDANDDVARFLANGYGCEGAISESFGVFTSSLYGVVMQRYVADVKASASSGALVLGAYHHVVMTYDGAKQSLYIDGGLRGTVPDTRSAGNATNPCIAFGAYNSAGSSLKGAIDELAIYDKALSASQVLAHFTASGR